MQNIPTELEKLKLEMDKCFEVYQKLESFNYRFSKDDYDKKWIIFGGIKEILELIKLREK